MTDILWQSRSPVVYDSFHAGQLTPGANGGNAYDFNAAVSLSKKFALEMDLAAVFQGKENVFTYWNRVRRIAPSAQVVIQEPYPLVFSRRKPGVKYVGMIHHIDDHLGRSTLKHRWYFGTLKDKLKELDAVVTVSVFWKEYLQTLGCRNVHVIYNAFHPEEFEFSEKEIAEFREKYNLEKNPARPLIYVGGTSRQKGVYDVYESLKNEPFDLIMSGPHNHAADLPIRFLQLNRKEYLLLLKCADLALTMSTMVEGWNRIAHEALLCGTPVIGSGVGGMKELLSGAGQKIISDPAGLPAAIRDVLIDRARFVSSGKEYLQKFNLNNFELEWSRVIGELLNQPGNTKSSGHVRNQRVV